MKTSAPAAGSARSTARYPVPNEFDERLADPPRHLQALSPGRARTSSPSKSADCPPARAACPAGCNAHGYVSLIRERKFKEALELIRERIPLPAVCGRVCGLCEDECNRGEPRPGAGRSARSSALPPTGRCSTTEEVADCRRPANAEARNRPRSRSSAPGRRA